MSPQPGWLPRNTQPLLLTPISPSEPNLHLWPIPDFLHQAKSYLFPPNGPPIALVTLPSKPSNLTRRMIG